MSKLLKKQISLICSRYAAGEESRTLAKEYGVSVSTIIKHVKLHGVSVTKRAGRKKSLREDQIKLICSRYAAGEVSGQLSKEYGVSVDTIINYVKLRGIPVVERESRKKFGDHIIVEIAEAYKAGKNVEVLAEEYKVGPAFISNHLRKMGIKPNRNGRSKLTEKDEQEIITRFLAGESSNKLGEEFNVTGANVRRIIKKVKDSCLSGDKVDFRSRQKRFTDKEQDELLRRYNLGQSKAQLSKEFGVPYNTVNRALEKAIKRNEKNKLNLTAVELKGPSRQSSEYFTIDSPNLIDSERALSETNSQNSERIELSEFEHNNKSNVQNNL